MDGPVGYLQRLFRAGAGNAGRPPDAFPRHLQRQNRVYVMPSDGGQPKQLTFYQGSATPLSDRMGIHNEVVTWFPDSKRIVFLSRRDASNGWIKRPYSVSIEGGLPEPLPMDQGGLVSFSPDGTRIGQQVAYRERRSATRDRRGKSARPGGQRSGSPALPNKP